MKTLLVLTFEVPDPESVPDLVAALDPPNLPWFTGTLHVVVPPHAAELETWLEEE